MSNSLRENCSLPQSWRTTLSISDAVIFPSPSKSIKKTRLIKIKCLHILWYKMALKIPDTKWQKIGPKRTKICPNTIQSCSKLNKSYQNGQKYQKNKYSKVPKKRACTLIFSVQNFHHARLLVYGRNFSHISQNFWKSQF